MPAEFLNVTAWRLPTSEEMQLYINKIKNLNPKKKNSKSRKISSSILVFRTHLKPIDMYCYLKARFGNPNGIQTLLKSNDSDNIFHWDYVLRSGEDDIYIVGSTRQIHLHLPGKLRDKDWPLFLQAIKRDFARVGRAKSKVLKSLEKWVVFQNKFAVLADSCAELHDKIKGTPSFKTYKSSTSTKKNLDLSLKRARKVSARAEKLHSDCLKLRLFTPIMAEAFLNMFILTFCRPEIRSDAIAYESLKRSKIPDRLDRLFDSCLLMAKPIDKKLPIIQIVYADD